MPLGKNSQGFQEFRNEIDGTVLILVPAGPFTMGSSDQTAFSDEKPQHTVDVPAFCIGKTEVTNARFARFVEATGYRAEGDGWKRAASDWGDQAPVVEVSWYDALAYCRWAGLRLPTEAEWEKAGRGTDARRFPWGDDWDDSRAWYSLNSQGRAGAVGTRPSGVSPYGALDMAGNVWEWCSSVYRPYPYNPTDGRENPEGSEPRVLRGGSWNGADGWYVRNAYRCSWIGPSGRGRVYGFRCAASPAKGGAE